MPMTDMRLSAMTAALTEELVGLMQADEESGCIVVGTRAEGSSNTTWTRERFTPFEVVSIEGPQGWTVRASSRVMTKIREEVARHPAVETGGEPCRPNVRAV